ncbi:hypothetical protein CJ739_3396 [Mariniflexile rhizosphaerae]|uniref:right-handed parallel beta-helix repeat-containing protein n=1 Tax=unclassified Mariniflexile TaxID=2643887 RepID=UPI000CC81FF2|nr:NosD domain-containing protein [Mariniflexile sp. TRM1-10]AXP82458.1 hypothetical protein CJ739_3396 [Mariniflexile sp. TRM1-10]PLB18400.1 MAG: Uronase [Flavobacteriaceae bacterium FS1-H7996/R]
MKMIIKPMLFVFTLTLFLTSCNNEELFVEDLTEVVTPNDPDGTTPEEDVDTTNPDASLPCDFDLNNLQPNQTVIINCTMDLGGATINVPSSVTIVYEGGDIINGTLNFLDNATISGELLNSTLTMGGAKPQLKDPAFEFNPKRWGIVEGETTSAIALKNRDILESMMVRVKDMGVTTFKIDKMDAYFEVSKVTSTTTNQNFYPSIEAINIPSDFNLFLTDNTHLRTYPNNASDGRLIAFRDVSNSSIKGGNLHGDRDEHDYSNHSKGEGGNHIMEVHGSNNILIDNVNMQMGSKGGLFINSINFTFQPDYIPSHHVTIKNCVFKDNRRMSVALTDGNNILFENNQFIDTALDRPNSDGGVVGFAVNIEAVRTRDEITGALILYERVYDVVFRGNSETGSRVGGLNIYTGENVIVENNEFENKVNWSYASSARIRNNTFKASTKSKVFPAINAGGSGDTVFDNQISGNNISGYDIGISAYHKNVKIFENNIENCLTGIQLKSISDSEIYNNNIFSNVPSSRGIMIHYTNANNINIYKNKISTITDNLFIDTLNQEVGQENYTVSLFENECISNASVTLSQAKGVVFENNTSNGKLQLTNTKEIKIVNNIIKSLNTHGILLMGENFNVHIEANSIFYPENTRFQCIYIASTNIINEIFQDSNSCN